MTSASGKNDAKKFSALVVDDSVVIRKIAEKYLANRGIKTKLAENGQEAVDIFKAGNSFDIVFMDMEMPVMDGIQATKELRTMGVKTLIYGVAESESQAYIDAFMEAGLNEFFEKPIDFAKLDAVLKRLNM